MTTYGDKKVKDMVRSILPSTARQRARTEKAKANRAARRGVNMSMSDITRDPDEYDGIADFGDAELPGELATVISDRRGYDKTAPIQKWAKAVTSGDPETRLAKIASLLPNNTIGRHVIQHVKFMAEFDQEREARNLLGLHRRKKYVTVTDAERAVMLEEIITRGLHAHFNKAMRLGHRSVKELVKGTGVYDINKVYIYAKYILKGPQSGRMLLGLHDIKPFLKDVRDATQWRSKNSDGFYHPEWSSTLESYLKMYVKKGRSVKAMLAVDIRYDTFGGSYPNYYPR